MQWQAAQLSEHFSARPPAPMAEVTVGAALLARALELLAGTPLTALDYIAVAVEPTAANALELLLAASPPDAPPTLGIAWPAVVPLHAAAKAAFEAASSRARARTNDDDVVTSSGVAHGLITGDAPSDAAAALLLVAPFHYSAWNARKARVAAALTGRPAATAAVAAELRLAGLVTGRHAKAGDAWAHRRWLTQVLAREITAAAAAAADATPVPFAPAVALLLGELADAARAGERRPRNYHAWTHRGHVGALLLRLARTGGDAVAVAIRDELASDGGGACGDDHTDVPPSDAAAAALLSNEVGAVTHRAALLGDYSAAHYAAQLLTTALADHEGGAPPTLTLVARVAQLACCLLRAQLDHHVSALPDSPQWLVVDTCAARYSASTLLHLLRSRVEPPLQAATPQGGPYLPLLAALSPLTDPAATHSGTVTAGSLLPRTSRWLHVRSNVPAACDAVTQWRP